MFVWVTFIFIYMYTHKQNQNKYWSDTLSKSHSWGERQDLFLVPVDRVTTLSGQFGPVFQGLLGGRLTHDVPNPVSSRSVTPATRPNLFFRHLLSPRLPKVPSEDSATGTIVLLRDEPRNLSF